MEHNSHTMKFTCQECTAHSFLVYLQSCATISAILEHFHHPKKPCTPSFFPSAPATSNWLSDLYVKTAERASLCEVHLWGWSAEAAGGSGSSTRRRLQTVLVTHAVTAKLHVWEAWATDRHLLTALESESPSQWADRASFWRGFSFWLAGTCHLTMCSPEGQRGKPCAISSYKGTNPIMGCPPSWPHLTPLTSKYPIFKRQTPLCHGFDILKFWGNIQSPTSGTVGQFSCSLVRLFAPPMDCTAPGFSVHHQLLELTQTHVHQVSDAIQPSVIPFSSRLQSFPA